jgi:Sec7-like guanine-nucleotide exchange factor
MVAEFISSAPGLNKLILGEFLGDRDDFSIAVLRQFVKLFVIKYHTNKKKHKELPLVETVRAFL